MAERPVLDPQILQRLQGMDDDGTFVAELAQVFLTEAPIRWAAIVGCSRAGRAPRGPWPRWHGSPPAPGPGPGWRRSP